MVIVLVFMVYYYMDYIFYEFILYWPIRIVMKSYNRDYKIGGNVYKSLL
jgi:hypothetical protein